VPFSCKFNTNTNANTQVLCTKKYKEFETAVFKIINVKVPLWCLIKSIYRLLYRPISNL